MEEDCSATQNLRYSKKYNLVASYNNGTIRLPVDLLTSPLHFVVYTFSKQIILQLGSNFFPIYEPPHGKFNNLHRQKQRRRSASR